MRELKLEAEDFYKYPGPVGCLDCDNEFEFETKVYEFNNSDLALVMEEHVEDFIAIQIKAKGFKDASISFDEDKYIVVCGKCNDCGSTDLMFDF